MDKTTKCKGCGSSVDRLFFDTCRCGLIPRRLDTLSVVHGHAFVLQNVIEVRPLGDPTKPLRSLTEAVAANDEAYALYPAGRGA